MRNLRWMRLAAVALTVTLSVGSLAPTFAAPGVAVKASPIGKVAITGNSYFDLKQIQVMPEQNGKLATFTITVHNKGNNELLFIDYWVRLKSKSGNQFTVKLLPSDKDKNRVSPGSSTDITFYATVNENTNLQDLVVQFIKWDFSKSNFETVIGEISVPATYSNVTPVNRAAIISVGKTDIQASVKKLVSTKNEKYHVSTVHLDLENVGLNSLTLPNYSFSIRTAGGLMYPLDAKEAKDLIINPKETKEVKLTGSIPLAVAAEGWQLVVTESLTEPKMTMLVATLQLPKASQEQQQGGGVKGKAYTFTNKDGVYTAIFNGLYRLPWEDDDILTADLTLSNKGTGSLPIPKLTGYFMLDGGVKVEAKLIQTSKIIALGANSAVSFQFAAKIPYTYAFSKAKLVLQEKEVSEKEGEAAVTKDVLDFSSNSEVQAIPFIDNQQFYTLDDIGRKAKFTTKSVATYTGKTSDTYTAQVEVENLEKRFTGISRLVAHFRTPDGTIFPATITEIKNKISPSGKALLNVWANLPKGYETAEMQLLMGEAITEGKLTEGEAKPDSYVKPVAFWLPAENKEVKEVLKDVQVFPYAISLNRIGTSIVGNELTLKFNYELTKDLLTETNTEGRKLVLTFEDADGNKSFEKSYEVKDFNPSEGEQIDPNKLIIGKHEEFKIIVQDEGLIYKQQFLKKYSVSLYDEFQGQRKLLASQKLDWFIYSE
ncbi:hypothetical protein [Paenibacillus eucommiae]|uniref:Uncharacterized protein n=1 Tax=Paenibacillus eucommiae TaxID=1355755 RepID=A0ABS4IYZ1_9BACL|nr:hypothetical protein [Paenibacillus eucommiae]MBP1992758.1 hypothetical protein [Paenibacillus eucommiae]